MTHSPGFPAQFVSEGMVTQYNSCVSGAGSPSISVLAAQPKPKTSQASQAPRKCKLFRGNGETGGGRSMFYQSLWAGPFRGLRVEPVVLESAAIE